MSLFFKIWVYWVLDVTRLMLCRFLGFRIQWCTRDIPDQWVWMWFKFFMPNRRNRCRVFEFSIHLFCLAQFLNKIVVILKCVRNNCIDKKFLAILWYLAGNTWNFSIFTFSNLIFEWNAQLRIYFTNIWHQYPLMTVKFGLKLNDLSKVFDT